MVITKKSTIGTIDGITLSTSPIIDGLAEPIVFDSIGDSFVFTILLIFERFDRMNSQLIFERFIRMNSQLALSWNFKYITERNLVLDGEMQLYHLLQRKSIC